MKWFMPIVLTLVLCGCATGPSKTAVNSGTLDADRVIYFEQSDRVPKDVLLAPHQQKGAVAGAMATIPAELIGEAIEEALKILPELADKYSKERMYNALLGRRMLFIGYETPEQLDKIQEIIETMNGSIEFLTPEETMQAK